MQEDPTDPQRRRAAQLRNNYIGYLDPVSLVSRSKLTLNRNNDRFYHNYLVPLKHLPQRGLNALEHLLRRAFLWFKERGDMVCDKGTYVDGNAYSGPLRRTGIFIGPEFGTVCWFVDSDYNEKSFFVRHAYFPGANDPYKALRTTLKAEISRDQPGSLGDPPQ